jgi:hypothetical protein
MSGAEGAAIPVSGAEGSGVPMSGAEGAESRWWPGGLGSVNRGSARSGSAELLQRAPFRRRRAPA